MERDNITVTVKEEVDGQLVDKEYQFVVYHSTKYLSYLGNNYTMLIDKVLTNVEIAEGKEPDIDTNDIMETNISVSDTSYSDYIFHLYQTMRYKTILVSGLQGKSIFISNSGKKLLLDLSNIDMMDFFYKDKNAVMADVLDEIKNYINVSVKPVIVQESVSSSLESVSGSVATEVERQTDTLSTRISNVDGDLTSFKNSTSSNLSTLNNTINGVSTTENTHYNTLSGLISSLNQDVSAISIDKLKPIGAPIPRLIDLTVSGQEYVLRENEIVLNGTLLNKNSFPDLFNVYKYTYNKDTDTNTDYFRLPDLRSRVLWGTDSLTDPYIEPAIPNIKGTFPTIESADGCYNLNGFGRAIYLYKSDNSSNVDDSNGNKDDTAALDASRCSNVYKDDCNTVQPPAVKVIWVTRYR